MNHGLRRIESGELPLSNRLLREVHELLMSGVRGGDKAPGEFRRSQNWLGGTRPGNARFVPPPAPEVPQAMSDLEKFLHDDPEPTPLLIKAALAHVQFETIHPFLDGNGRVGRLLITLLLCAEKVLQQPLLYLSLYFKQHRDAYYDHLQRVRTDGAWEEWLAFFLEGVIAVAGSATETARQIRQLVERDREAIHGLGRGAASALRVHELAGRRVVLTASQHRRAARPQRPDRQRCVRAARRRGDPAGDDRPPARPGVRLRRVSGVCCRPSSSPEMTVAMTRSRFTGR